MTLVDKAQSEGLSFVASLWTEKGITNPNAFFRNSIIGMCWVSVCISVARILPPFRTARCAFSRMLLPKVLKDVANIIRVTVETHIKTLNENDGLGRIGEEEEEDPPTMEEYLDNDDDGPDNEQLDDNVDEINEEDTTGNDQQEQEQSSNAAEDLVRNIVQDSSITMSGGMTSVTVFEPRLSHMICGCRPPKDLVSTLSSLTNVINDMIFSSLTLRVFSRAGFEELKVAGLSSVYENTADILEDSANKLRIHCTSSVDTSADDTTDVENNGRAPFDPLHLYTRSITIKKLTSEWILKMGRDEPHNFDNHSFYLYWKMVQPWITACGFGLLLALFSVLKKGFTPLTYKRIFLPPYYDLPQFVWCIKFALGFTLIVICQLYWPAFSGLEVPTKDNTDALHFSGWTLIAYAFATTQTTEGTWKKSLQRALGTVVGGCSAWLAMRAVHLDSAGTHPYPSQVSVGLGVWMTVTSTVAAYFFLPKGLHARFGLDKDFAWGPGKHTIITYCACHM